MQDIDINFDDEDSRDHKHGFGIRHIQIILAFLCLTTGIAMRTNFSIAIVAMTDNATSSNPNVPTFEWNNTSVMLSSFFWGYIGLQIPSGYISKIYGVKYLLLISFFINTVAFLFIPLLATESGIGVMILRAIQGLAQGCLFPCAHTLMGKWAPAEERSVMGIIIYSGLSVGSVISLVSTGFICSSSVGWPASFYLFGAIGLGWCALYLKLGHNSPASHPTITERERRYIEVSLGQSEHDKERPVPWKPILTSIHFWAIVCANIGSAWGYTFLMTQIPTYLAKVMKFDIKSNGVVSAIPYVVGTFTGLAFAALSDCLIGNEYISRITSRRMFQLFGSYGLICCLMLLAYEARTQVTAVLFLSLGNAAYTATLVGYSVNHVDLSPRFAGIMMGISNFISQVVAIFSPLMVQFVVSDLNNPKEWRNVFITVAVFYFVCSTTYVIFASATRQRWDGPESEESIDRQSIRSIRSRRQTFQSLMSWPGFE